MKTKRKPVWKKRADALAKAFAKYHAMMQTKEARYLIDFGYQDSYAAGFVAGWAAANRLRARGQQ